MKSERIFIKMKLILNTDKRKLSNGVIFLREYVKIKIINIKINMSLSAFFEDGYINTIVGRIQHGLL